MSTFTYLACRTLTTGRSPVRVAHDALDRVLEQVIDQGGYALRQISREYVRTSSEVRYLLDSGHLRQLADGTIELTPLAQRVAEDRMLRDLFRSISKGGPGRHQHGKPGAAAEPGDEVRPLPPGEPVEHLDLTATLSRALERGLPFTLHPDDLHTRPGQAGSRCATVLLLDLSGSMHRYGKFTVARRAALALRALVRRSYPGDELLLAGFASRAEAIPASSLLEIMPRNVGLFDPGQSNHRLAISSTEVPEHFTNIQAGLRLARKMLRSRTQFARQVILITDGEPTAHLEGQELVLAYPPTEAAVQCTLAEARGCANDGMALSVFGLVGEFSQPGLRLFVERLARAGKGTALCCPPRQLGSGLLTGYFQTRSRMR